MPVSPFYGVNFQELENSPRVVINQQGVSATRTYLVAWDDWQNFARELIGIWRIIGGATMFVPPIRFPGLPNLVVSDLVVEPFQPESPDGNPLVTLGALTNTYAGGARVTAHYTTPFKGDSLDRPDLPSVPAGTYLSYLADLSAEIVTVPGRTFNWVGASPAERVPDDINPGLLLPTGAYTLRWDRVLLPPWTAIRNARGKVNSATFVSAPAGTVIFLGAQVSRQFQFVEDGGFWQVEYRFAENLKELTSGAKVGWNYFYRQTPLAGENWVEIKDQNNRNPYLSADFSSLFAFGA